ncbi:MAG: ferritin-like domain-containing protein [bacterium]|nr:ferritin-like domain-containing protein [bacterium]
MSLESIVTTLKTHWKFDYETNVNALRDLYEKAKKEQWNAAVDIPWDLEINKEGVGDILDPSGERFPRYDFVKALSNEAREQFAARRSAWTLSQFLHGEQGALLCCGQLVEAVPDIDGKLYAATQVVDEARHVEVFHRYITRLDQVYTIEPSLHAVLNAILEADLWQMKCVGMQVITESLAMGTFKSMKENTRDDLLRNVVELTAQDEARHVSYGLIYMKEELPRMSDPDRERVEDFALGAVRMLTTGGGGAADSKGGGILSSRQAVYTEVGIDYDAAMQEIGEKANDPEFANTGPRMFDDHVVPQLQRVGLVTDRVAPGYRELGFDV